MFPKSLLGLVFCILVVESCDFIPESASAVCDTLTIRDLPTLPYRSIVENLLVQASNIAPCFEPEYPDQAIEDILPMVVKISIQGPFADYARQCFCKFRLSEMIAADLSCADFSAGAPLSLGSGVDGNMTMDSNSTMDGNSTLPMSGNETLADSALPLNETLLDSAGNSTILIAATNETVANGTDVLFGNDTLIYLNETTDKSVGNFTILNLTEYQNSTVENSTEVTESRDVSDELVTSQTVEVFDPDSTDDLFTENPDEEDSTDNDMVYYSPEGSALDMGEMKVKDSEGNVLSREDSPSGTEDDAVPEGMEAQANEIISEVEGKAGGQPLIFQLLTQFKEMIDSYEQKVDDFCTEMKNFCGDQKGILKK